MASLPGLLAPFAQLHPVYTLARVSQLSFVGHYEAARDLTLALQSQLDAVKGSDAAYAQKLRDGSWMNLRFLDIVLGTETADQDSVSRVSDPEDEVRAAYLERVAACYRRDHA